MGLETIGTIIQVTNSALRKRVLLPATESTLFTIMAIIVVVDLLMYISLYMVRHMGPMATRRVVNPAPNTKLSQMQQHMNTFMKGCPVAPPNIVHQTIMPQTTKQIFDPCPIVHIIVLLLHCCECGPFVAVPFFLRGRSRSRGSTRVWSTVEEDKLATSPWETGWRCKKKIAKCTTNSRCCSCVLSYGPPFPYNPSLFLRNGYRLPPSSLFLGVRCLSLDLALPTKPGK